MSSDHDDTTPVGAPGHPNAPIDSTPTRVLSDDSSRQSASSPIAGLPSATAADAPSPQASPAAPAPAAPVMPDAQPMAVAPDVRRGPRTSTLVGALVLILLGAGVAAVGLGGRLDLQAALIALLVIAGSALLVGALLSARRSR